MRNMSEAQQRDILPTSMVGASGLPESRLLLVGARHHVRRLIQQGLGEGPWSGLPLVGFVCVNGRGRQVVVHPGSRPVPFLGRIEQLPELVDRSGATDVMLALSEQPAVRVQRRLGSTAQGSQVRVHWIDVNSLPRKATARPEATGGLVIRPGRIAKRVLDFTVAAGILLLISPLLLFVAALILVTSGRPIFYTQERVGQGGRLFRILKFRSMRVDAECETGPIWATDHDERCTWIGDWLRHTSIDELPQLINVLKGEMSLVGPRPERPVFVDQFEGELVHYSQRHAMPVGMTGWAQVHGWRGRTSLRKRLQYDLDYVRHWTFDLDIRIAFMTIQHVLQHKTRWGGGIAGYAGGWRNDGWW